MPEDEVCTARGYRERAARVATITLFCCFIECEHSHMTHYIAAIPVTACK